ncbi:MAG: hypothetical protein ACLUHA_15480 [Bacteroides stercoris]
MALCEGGHDSAKLAEYAEPRSYSYFANIFFLAVFKFLSSENRRLDGVVGTTVWHKAAGDRNGVRSSRCGALSAKCRGNHSKSFASSTFSRYCSTNLLRQKAVAIGFHARQRGSDTTVYELAYVKVCSFSFIVVIII